MINGLTCEVVQAINGNSPLMMFSGEYAFLSNMAPCVIHHDGYIFQSTECAYQAAKFNDPTIKQMFVEIDNGRKAKVLARKLVQASDVDTLSVDQWNSMRVRLMYDINYQKYTTREDLMEKLMATGTTPLIEGNTWNDQFWGVDVRSRKGLNTLGGILMAIRNQNMLFDI